MISSASAMSAPQSVKLCKSQTFGNSIFRAYADPKPVTEQAFTTTGGKKIKLNSLPGPRALLVNFWTTWCTPCIEEMPSMDRLQGRISRDQLLILPLVRDGKGLTEASRFYRVHELANLPVAADRFGKISHDHHIGPVPQTLFVDQQGMVKGLLIGGVDWESKPVLQLLDSCLNVKIKADKTD
jgi:thiol-disulfide isomerase/thioredoxin